MDETRGPGPAAGTRELRRSPSEVFHLLTSLHLDLNLQFEVEPHLDLQVRRPAAPPQRPARPAPGADPPVSAPPRPGPPRCASVFVCIHHTVNPVYTALGLTEIAAG
jgi:hypothetical protein